VGFAFRAILTAVEELHSLGYVHRDLKLDNFMVSQKCKIISIQSISYSTISSLSHKRTRLTLPCAGQPTTCLPSALNRKRGVCLSSDQLIYGRWASSSSNF